MKPAPDYYVFPTDLHDREDLTTQHMLEVVPVVEREYYDLATAENQELRELLKICRGSMWLHRPTPKRALIIARIDKALED